MSLDSQKGKIFVTKRKKQGTEIVINLKFPYFS